jgi:type IV secretory pathway VirB10-like protein
MSSSPSRWLFALFCASALMATACGRPAAETKSAGTAPAATTAPPAPPVAPSNELRPEPRSVTVADAKPPTTPPPSQAELATKERELAKRLAGLEAREKALRDREREKLKDSKASTDSSDNKADERASEEPAAPESEGAEMGAEEAEPAPAPAPEPSPAPLPEPVTVPAGKVMGIEMLTTVSSKTSHAGDLFRARLAGSVRDEDGRVAIPAGSEVVGEVVDAAPARRIGGQARLALRFTDLILPDGTTVPIAASFLQAAPSKAGKDAAKVGGGAAAGAVLGHILDKGDGRGSAVGAILGAAVGLLIAAGSHGEEVTFTQGTAVDIQLDRPLEVRPRETR